MYTLDLTRSTRQNFGFTKLRLRKLKILPFYLSILRFALTLEERYHLLFHTYTLPIIVWSLLAFRVTLYKVWA